MSGRQEAMTLVHAVATSPDEPVAPAVEALDDPEASGEALRHVLVGGVHAVEDFAAEVAEAEGGEPLSAHQTTKIIGEVLSELDPSVRPRADSARRRGRPAELRRVGVQHVQRRLDLRASTRPR